MLESDWAYLYIYYMFYITQLSICQILFNTKIVHIIMFFEVTFSKNNYLIFSFKKYYIVKQIPSKMSLFFILSCLRVSSWSFDVPGTECIIKISV